jgi:hypothetical protein
VKGFKGFKKKPITWYVDENKCWICTSHCKNSKGYPQYNKKGSKHMQMSRYMYEQEYNCSVLPTIGGEKIFICHKCDNPACINPEHLFLGTQYDNLKDMVKKNRQQMGEKHYAAKLSSEQVSNILHDKRVNKIIAKEYGVSNSTIDYIKNGKRWKGVTKIA